MRPGLLRHRKFARLARLLGSQVMAVGHLELLWAVAYENGDDLLGDAGDVEYMAQWAGEPGKLVEALVDAGFLDRCNGPETDPSVTENYRVHDLLDHAPEYVVLRKQREDERRKHKICEHCKGEYRSTDSRSKYCSPACRTAACRARRANRAAVTDFSGKKNNDSNGGNGHVTERSVTVADRNTTPAPAPTPTPAPIARQTDVARESYSQNHSQQPDCLSGPQKIDLSGLDSFRSALGTALGLGRPVGVGKAPERVGHVFSRWLNSFGEQVTLEECVRLAEFSKTGPPQNLSWWCGWLETVPDSKIPNNAGGGS